MSVSLFDRETLEEALIDCIEEVLFLCPVIQPFGSIFNGSIEAVKRFQKLTSVEGSTGKRLNDLLDLRGDHVAVREILVIEDGAEEAFSQEVLYQHLIYCTTTHIRVERC